MKLSLCLMLSLSAVSLLSCKGRNAELGSGVLTDTANAQAPGTGIRLLTKKGDKAYPTQKMVRASYNSLTKVLQLYNQTGGRFNAAQQKQFTTLLRTAKLQLAMRPVAKVKQAPAAAVAGAPGNQIECTIATKAGSQRDAVRIAVNADEETFVNSPNGINSGAGDNRQNFTFQLSVLPDADGSRTLDVYFYENIQTQDEVGNIGCTIPNNNGEFCKEPLEGDDGQIGEFWCRRVAG